MLSSPSEAPLASRQRGPDGHPSSSPFAVSVCGSVGRLVASRLTLALLCVRVRASTKPALGGQALLGCRRGLQLRIFQRQTYREEASVSIFAVVTAGRCLCARWLAWPCFAPLPGRASALLALGTRRSWLGRTGRELQQHHRRQQRQQAAGRAGRSFFSERRGTTYSRRLRLLLLLGEPCHSTKVECSQLAIPAQFKPPATTGFGVPNPAHSSGA